jgi:hypothetical protein
MSLSVSDPKEKLSPDLSFQLVRSVSSRTVLGCSLLAVLVYFLFKKTDLGFFWAGSYPASTFFPCGGSPIRFFKAGREGVGGPFGSGTLFGGFFGLSLVGASFKYRPIVCWGLLPGIFGFFLF